jgi:ubiquinone/menaquinone biosynthesis C-methylase UbiE
MGFWAARVVPLITEKTCNNSTARPYRQRQCADLDGDVVEIGFGSGHNLEYLPPSVRSVAAVEPSERARRYAAPRISASTIPVTWAGLDGQSLDLPDDAFDHAISSLTLCTIPDATAALRELRRVLKPGGRLHFLEHGRSPDAKVAKRQDRWDPFQQKLFDGCHVTRQIDAMIEDAGFRIERLENSEMKGPKVFGYMYEGVAVAP